MKAYEPEKQKTQGDEWVQNINDTLNTAVTEAGSLIRQREVSRQAIKTAPFCEVQSTSINDIKRKTNNQVIWQKVWDYPRTMREDND